MGDSSSRVTQPLFQQGIQEHCSTQCIHLFLSASQAGVLGGDEKRGLKMLDDPTIQLSSSKQDAGTVYRMSCSCDNDSGDWEAHLPKLVFVGKTVW